MPLLSEPRPRTGWFPFVSNFDPSGRSFAELPPPRRWIALAPALCSFSRIPHCAERERSLWRRAKSPLIATVLSFVSLRCSLVIGSRRNSPNARDVTKLLYVRARNPKRLFSDLNFGRLAPVAFLHLLVTPPAPFMAVRALKGELVNFMRRTFNCLKRHERPSVVKNPGVPIRGPSPAGGSNGARPPHFM